MDTTLTKVHFEVENQIHLFPDNNKNILILKDQDKQEYYPILGGQENNNEYMLNQVNANQNNGKNIDSSEIPPFKIVNTQSKPIVLTSMNIGTEPEELKLKSSLNFYGPFEVLYMPALKCEKGPLYSA